MLYAMDLTVLNLALPRLGAELQPSSAQLLWIVDIYGFFVAGLLITMGNLGDRIGRRRLLIRNMFLDPRQRTVAIGVWITSYSVGGAIGPLLGGVMLQHFSWGSVFLLAVPVMAVLADVAANVEAVMFVVAHEPPALVGTQQAQHGDVAGLDVQEHESHVVPLARTR